MKNLYKQGSDWKNISKLILIPILVLGCMILFSYSYMFFLKNNQTDEYSSALTISTENMLNPEIHILREKYKNNDIIGYLNIEDTRIDYPVVQTFNNYYYLYHDIYKEPNDAGWIFLDCNNDISCNDNNIIIYGHNMKMDYRFHTLRYYADENFFKLHPIITFNTLYGNYQWQVFTFFSTRFSYIYTTVFVEDDTRWMEILAQLKTLSMYDTKVDIVDDDKILLLSTCTDEIDATRYILGAKLIT